MYKDPLVNIHPDDIAQYHGVSGRILQRCRGQTGAGQEAGGLRIASTLQLQTHTDNDDQFLPDKIEAPQPTYPFHMQEEEALFNEALVQLEDEGVVPEGYGILPGEWSTGIYSEMEFIKVGRREVDI